MLVDFMIIGAQKCGTTTLSRILSYHPKLVGCSIKEPHFFSETKNWKEHIDEYHSLFDQKEGVLYFEASTTYTFYPYRKFHIWDDIYNYNPNMKFIYIVRNPYERIVSSYMHSYEKGYTDLTLEEAVLKKHFYIDISRYCSQIYPYIKKFGRENLKIIEFGELVNNTEKVLSELSEFLSIDKNAFNKVEKVHSNKSVGGNKLHHKYDSPSLYLRVIRKLFPALWDKITDNSDRKFDAKPQLSDEYKELIYNCLRLEIQELQKLMNHDLSHWEPELKSSHKILSLSKN